MVSLFESVRLDFLARWERPSPAQQIKVGHFDIVRCLGKGSYGRVYFARHKSSGAEVALKVQSKRSVIKKDSVANVLAEKHIQACMVRFDFVVHLLYHFKDSANLYLALEFLHGGDFFHLLKTRDKLDEDESRFYAANVILAVEFLHSVDILYRDLKPENILIDAAGYLKVSDFGFAKKCAGKTYSLCGTPEYLAPEIVSMRPYGKSVDVWAYGVLIFEMLCGRTPFAAPEYRDICNKICKEKVDFGDVKITDLCKDVVIKLLAKKPSKRLGVSGRGTSGIRDHGWFYGVAWEALVQRKVTAPRCFPAVEEVQKEQPFNLPGSGDDEDLYAAEFADF
ncbi:AGC/PKA protein kinase-like [Tropilaelaps mercedesae]|uniref:AGC/PKA protein kinase-like n=1 Tax=Tropilaelaps mercedesae TaxID=418985 RepID=A0A1V9XQ55_9ACAR|nr:AGC/PKA protein kinase-like [Tropilaelaps mercedesae]